MHRCECCRGWGLPAGLACLDCFPHPTPLRPTCCPACRRLQCLRYDALDVGCSQWYEDMAAFRGTMRDLEQMLGNILATAAAHASCLTARLDVIEAFARITTRDGLRRVQCAMLC
mgnify:CR=1 FL=1